MNEVWLNGQFMPADAARVPVFDRGFLLGDGVYEIVPVYSRKPFRLDEHLARLQYSLDGIRLANPHGLDVWRNILLELVARQDFADQSLLIQITRGVPLPGQPLRDHAFPRGAAPSVLAFAQPLVPPTQTQKAAGVCAVTAPDPRWQRCDLKVISLMANVLMRQQAVAAGCAETVFIRDGLLTEGAASNIFVVRAGTLCTPAPSAHMLTGITYDVVLELAARHGIAARVGEVTEAELRSADEIWMTSSTKEIMPVVMLDQAPVGSGQAGPMARQMDALYQQFKQDVMRR
jgi:D-alanine transaminase